MLKKIGPLPPTSPPSPRAPPAGLFTSSPAPHVEGTVKRGTSILVTNKMVSQLPDQVSHLGRQLEENWNKYLLTYLLTYLYFTYTFILNTSEVIAKCFHKSGKYRRGENIISGLRSLGSQGSLRQSK